MDSQKPARYIGQDCADARRVFVVTVTYGERKSLLSRMLAATIAQGITDIVVVDNGAQWDLEELVTEYPGACLRVVRMGRNTGSAAGFAAGINEAMAAGAAMLWLLDDDNRPLPGALTTLLATYDEQVGDEAFSSVALLAFRPEHQAEVASGGTQQRANARRSSFLGFHVLDLPRKVWSKRPWRRVSASGAIVSTVRLDVAPYSGLLVHRELVEAIGVPRADFVLYADDSEWTFRITRRGGRILLVTAAQIEDMESSWNAKYRHRSAIHGLLTGGSDFRVYYGIRNATYLQKCTSNSSFVFYLNRIVYSAVMKLASVKWRRGERYQLIQAAVKDGVRGSLGINERFPL